MVNPTYGGWLLGFAIGKDELNIVAGSILATAVVVLIFVLREKNTRLRTVFGLISLGLVAWAVFLFWKGEIDKGKRATETAQEVNQCKRTLSELRVLGETKLVLVQTEDEAKQIGQRMLDVIDNSKCNPNA